MDESAINEWMPSYIRTKVEQGVRVRCIIQVLIISIAVACRVNETSVVLIKGDLHLGWSGLWD